MTTKTSQKTEDMLDQTFANFDSEVADDEVSNNETKNSNSKNDIPKKKTNNLMLFVGLGVAAVGAIGYLFVLKPMLTPVVEAPVSQAAPVVPIVEAPVANKTQVSSEFKDIFEQQTSEFKTILTDIDSRMNNTELSIKEQKNINQKVEERLSNLETKNPIDIKKSIVKKSIVKKSIVKSTPKKELKNNIENNDSILINTVVNNKKINTVEKQVFENIEFHSIYGGRVWLKKSDGSLSTFSIGDKLPTGEIIKSVNEETFEVVTNKRTIKN